MSGWTRTGSRAVYAATYVVGGLLAAAVAGSLGGDTSLFMRFVIAGAAATVFLFGCSIVFKNSGFYDVYWSIAPVLGGAYWAQALGAWDRPRALLALGVTALWGLRLTSNWVQHFEGLHHEDWRYVDLRKKTGGAYVPASFFALHVFPFTLVTLGSWPLFEAIASTSPLGVLDVMGVVVGVGAVAIETVSDLQLHRFRRENREPKAFLRTGLWAYSRHPNYFGEMSYWWASALFGLAARPSPLMVLGALGVTGMIVGASIPMAEKRALAKRPEFADYQRKVSRLIPWFPRS